MFERVQYLFFLSRAQLYSVMPSALPYVNNNIHITL